MRKPLIVTFALLIIAIGVHADEPAQATVGSTGQYAPGAANAVGAQGGNVTAINLTSDQSTGKWQGFWGNVSGSLQLGDGSDIFYNWSGISFTAVHTSTGQDLDFTSVSDISTEGDKAAKDTEFGFTSTDPDSINSTMTGSGCAAGTIFSAAAGVTPFNSSGQAGDWSTCIGEDSGGAIDDTVFGTSIIQSGSDSFNGQSVQFQLMVPVISGGDNYYFFLEI